MKNTQIASKAAKLGIGADFVRASATSETRAAKSDGEKQNAAQPVDPILHQMIRNDAYFRSKRRDVAVESELQDWGEDEQEVLRILNLDKLSNINK